LNSPLAGRNSVRAPNGYTLVELLAVVTVIGVVSAIAIPRFNHYYETSCVQAAMAEVTGMIKEAKANALCEGRDYGVGFDLVNGRVSLISGKGRDDKWNTDDDRVVRSFSLAAKGGGLSFGYGSCGPAPNCGPVSDGVSFNSNNTIVCDDRLVGNAGAVYISSRGGAAMAIVMNSTEAGWKLYKWNGKERVRL